MQSRALSFAVTYKSYGAPREVLKREDIGSAAELGPNDVHVKILAAPINPSDLNMVENVYGVKAKLPAIGGNEGLGVVQKVGSKVSTLRIGDWVIPQDAGLGMWREELVTSEQSLFSVPDDIPVAYAATLGVNPCTAYRLLKDFENLQPGDYVIQNGANSMVGLAVVQLARTMGIKTINIVRSDRPDVEKVLKHLDNLGGDINIADTYLNTRQWKEVVDDLDGSIKLGLNCVGGDAAAEMARALPFGATMVTYGGMARQPMRIAPETLRYKQLKMRGFWITEWNKTHSREERRQMIDYLADQIRTKQLEFYYKLHDFDDFNHALKEATSPYQLRKTVLNMDYPDRLAEHDELQEDPENYEIFEYEKN